MPIKVKVPREHYNKYAELAKKHHVSLAECTDIFGWTKEKILQGLQSDPRLNFIRLRHWDAWAYSFLAYNRNTGLSLAEVVCLYKHLTTFEFCGCIPDFED